MRAIPCQGVSARIGVCHAVSAVDWVPRSVCQQHRIARALYQTMRDEEWTGMHEKLYEVSEKIGVTKAGQKVAGLGKLVRRKSHTVMLRPLAFLL